MLRSQGIYATLTMQFTGRTLSDRLSPSVRAMRVSASVSAMRVSASVQCVSPRPCLRVSVSMRVSASVHQCSPVLSPRNACLRVSAVVPMRVSASVSVSSVSVRVAAAMRVSASETEHSRWPGLMIVIGRTALGLHGLEMSDLSVPTPTGGSQCDRQPGRNQGPIAPLQEMPCCSRHLECVVAPSTVLISHLLDEHCDERTAVVRAKYDASRPIAEV